MTDRYSAPEPGAGAEQRAVHDRGEDLAASHPRFDGMDEAKSSDRPDRSVRRLVFRWCRRVETDGDHRLRRDEFASRVPFVSGGVAHQSQIGQKDRRRCRSRLPKQDRPPNAVKGNHAGSACRTLASGCDGTAEALRRRESPPGLKERCASAKDMGGILPRKRSQFGIAKDSLSNAPTGLYARWIANYMFDGRVVDYSGMAG